MCKKTVKESPNGFITFLAGDVYPEDRFHIMGEGWICLTNRFGERNFFAGSFLDEHFRKLEPAEELPIPKDYTDDHDAAEYDRFLSGLPSSRGCLIAAAITIAFIATLIITWRS